MFLMKYREEIFQRQMQFYNYLTVIHWCKNSRLIVNIKN